MPRLNPIVYSLRNRTEGSTDVDENLEIVTQLSNSDTLTANSKELSMSGSLENHAQLLDTHAGESESEKRPITDTQPALPPSTPPPNVELPTYDMDITTGGLHSLVPSDNVAASVATFQPATVTNFSAASVPTPTIIDMEVLLQVLNNLSAKIDQGQVDLSAKIDQGQAELSARINQMQGNVNNVQECIEMRLSEQKEALERLTEQVAQGHSRINDLESSTTALLVTAREERQRIQDQCVRNHTVLREEMHGQTEQLQLRLEQVEEATVTLSSRIDTLSNECTQLAEKAADCHTVQLCQRVESRLNNQFSVQQHLESQVKELERRFQGLDTDQVPRLPTQPSDNPVHSNRGANGPAESLVTQTSERSVLNATVGGLTIDQAALLHHPARQWSESMPTFTGKATENPIRFLNKFEEYARTFGLNDTEKLKCLGSALRGNAFYWYEMLQTTTTSYQQFIDMFRQQYWSLRTQGNLRAQLHTERYDPKKGMS
ncbi:uncharacterized protein LOC134533625 [Bacillus rossius redtenbacheri]|uniref:uncharacterized protein LOC134533625 n=1 Tax=Bacillus rossius redtenbacheri TaxID=93214 RepID=UPI002FDC8B93